MMYYVTLYVERESTTSKNNKHIKMECVTFNYCKLFKSLEHTPGNPPSQLWKESLYGLLAKV